jgi:hypothetical protein
MNASQCWSARNFKTIKRGNACRAMTVVVDSVTSALDRFLQCEHNHSHNAITIPQASRSLDIGGSAGRMAKSRQ